MRQIRNMPNQLAGALQKRSFSIMKEAIIDGRQINYLDAAWGQNGWKIPMIIFTGKSNAMTCLKH